jgi:hypothetical protein
VDYMDASACSLAGSELPLWGPAVNERVAMWSQLHESQPPICSHTLQRPATEVRTVGKSEMQTRVCCICTHSCMFIYRCTQSVETDLQCGLEPFVGIYMLSSPNPWLGMLLRQSLGNYRKRNGLWLVVQTARDSEGRKKWSFQWKSWGEGGLLLLYWLLVCSETKALDFSVDQASRVCNDYMWNL